MNPRSSQQSRDQHAYIPQHVSDAMSRQMQQNVPAHLKQYVNPDKPTYVPQHVQQQLSQHMEKAMPGHLKAYSGAYLQQKVVQPGLTGVAAQGPRPVAPVAPTPNQLRQDHSNVNAGQYEARFNTNLFAPDQPGQAPQPSQPVPPDPNMPPQPAAQPQPGQPQVIQPTQPYQPAPEQPSAQQPQQQPYDFIMNPEQPQAPKQKLPGLSPNSSLLQRLLLLGGGLVVLIIIIAIARSLLSPGTDYTGYVSVAQQQQELLHILSPEDDTTFQNLSANNQNFVATASLSLSSAQSQLIQYLGRNGQKVETKQLNLKLNAQTDQQLANAATAGTYDQTFSDVMKSELEQYVNTLVTTYKQATGKNGRALLNDQYCQAQLLRKQLDPAGTVDLCKP
jgi:hypothetical protein